MRRPAVAPAKLLAIVFVAVAPFAIHLAVASASWTAMILTISVLQLVILGFALVSRRATRIKWLTAFSALLLFELVWTQQPKLGVAVVSGLPHALAYLALLIAFSSSLLPGRRPVLTRVVVAVRGPLSDELLAHTRQVTWVWCFFFAAQLIVSATLFLSASLETWSFFINVLNLPLVAIMFSLEAGYRFIRFHDLDNLADILRVVAKATPGGLRHADSA